MKRHLVSSTLTAVAFPALLLAGCETKRGAPPPTTMTGPPPKPSVGIVALTRHDLPLFMESVATVDGYVNADIRARVRGFLRSQEYKDGATVRAGQTLFTIDASEWLAAAEAAKASVSRAKTAESRAKIELDRDLALFKAGTLSQQDLDNAKANLADAEGQVRAAKAELDQALLNVSYTTVRSPITGIASVAQVRIGNLVGQAEPTLLTTVSQTDPMRVTFAISELDYVKYPECFRNLDKRDLAWAKKEFARLEAHEGGENGAPQTDGAVEVVLADGTVYAHRGVVVSLNRSIDPTTGTIQLQALVPNRESLLRPGQYARVRMQRSNEGKAVLAVPEKALISVQGQYSVAVVGQDGKVALKHVELGATAGNERVVTSGVQDGDRVVVEGTQRVSDGVVVDARDAVTAMNAKD